MRKLKTLALALLLTSLAIAPAYAKRHGGGSSFACDNDRMTKIEQLKEVLELSPQQEAEIQTIISERRQTMTAQREAGKAHKRSLRDIFASETLDEVRLRELLSKQAELKADKMVAQHATHARINQVLTPEQQAKHQELRQQRMERKGEFRGPGRRMMQGDEKKDL